jgi:hypothetical protein
VSNLVEDTAGAVNNIAAMSLRNGQMQMQTAVVIWINQNREVLPDAMILSLMAAMDAARSKPVEPTYWDEKSKDRREEFKEEDARSRGGV